MPEQDQLSILKKNDTKSPAEEKWLAKKKEYEEVVNKSGGELDIWICQGLDKNIQNSGGVCFALTREWLNANMKTELDVWAIESGLINTPKRSNYEKLIPDIFIKEQEIYGHMNKTINSLRKGDGTFMRAMHTIHQGKTAKNMVDEMTSSLERVLYKNDISKPVVVNAPKHVLGDLIFLVKEIQEGNKDKPIPLMINIDYNKSVDGKKVRTGHSIGILYPAVGSKPIKFFDSNNGLSRFEKELDFRKFFSDSIQKFQPNQCTIVPFN